MSAHENVCVPGHPWNTNHGWESAQTSRLLYSSVGSSESKLQMLACRHRADGPPHRCPERSFPHSHLPFFLTFFSKSKDGAYTMVCLRHVYSNVVRRHVYVYFFFRLFSTIGYSKIVSVVPWCCTLPAFRSSSDDLLLEEPNCGIEGTTVNGGC